MTIHVVNPKEEVVNASLAHEDLYFYSRYMLQKQRGLIWQRAPHHERITQFFQDVLDGKIIRGIINIPPRYSKTRSCTSFITYGMGLYPDSQFILTSYSGRLAGTNSWEAREIIKLPVYQQIFPGVVIDDTSQARDEWRTKQGGVVYATGAGGSLTGYGAGLMRPGFGGAIIIDDPHKPDEVHSDVARRNVIDWFQDTLQSRVNSKHTPIIVIMQRLHEEDLSGWLLNGGSGEHWEHLCMPALQPDGTALWPDKHSVKDLLRMQESYQVTFPGQYQQNPTPPMGGMFKVNRINWVETFAEVTRDVSQWVRAWDFAATASDDAAATVGVLMGKRATGGIAIADVERLQGSPEQVEESIIGCAKRDRATIGHHHISIPQDPGQAGKSHVFYLTQKLIGYSVYSSPESGSKIQRAEPLAAQLNVGNITIVNAPWAMPLLEEMRFFPFGKFKDRVDACSRGFAHLTEERTLDFSKIDLAAHRRASLAGLRR